jgi:hypothetical protein
MSPWSGRLKRTGHNYPSNTRQRFSDSQGYLLVCKDVQIRMQGSSNVIPDHATDRELFVHPERYLRVYSVGYDPVVFNLGIHVLDIN